MLPPPDSNQPDAPLFVPDASGFFGIRLESIGGYGANVAGRILAEAAVLYEGFNGANFSSYGSEKKGSPVKAYVRLCRPEQAVRTSAPIEEPHLIGIFHEALALTQPVLAGLRADGIAILNTRKTPEEAQQHLKMSQGTIGVVDATGIARDEGSRVNMVMLGALCRTLPFLEPNSVKAVIAQTFGKKYPQAVLGNLVAFDRGWSGVTFRDVVPAPDQAAPDQLKEGPAYGYLNAPIGGVILNPGNSVLKNLSASRQGELPEFLPTKCINCTQCDLVCPDMCFVWAMETGAKGHPGLVLKGIDYQYCKGCMKCVVACPTEALVKRREEDGWADAHRVLYNFWIDRSLRIGGRC